MSNFDVYIEGQQVYTSKGLHVHKVYNFNIFKEAISENEGVLHCEGYDYEEFPDENMEAFLFETKFFLKGDWKCLVVGFML